MLNLNNKILSYDNEVIKHADSILQLNADVESTLFGVLSLTNSVIKTIQFIKVGNFYKARLVLTNEELNYLKDSKFKVVKMSADKTEDSNNISLVFDLPSITQTIKVAHSKETFELMKEIKEVSSRIDAITKHHKLLGINITNTNYIQKGMVPVAIDDKGNFVAAFPFANIITEVNGQVAVDGVVEINSSMIQYSTDTSVENAIRSTINATKALYELVNEEVAQRKELTKRVDELVLMIEKHLNSDIL